MQLARDHFRRTTLEYKSGPDETRVTRVQWANVATLDVERVELVERYV